MQARTVPPTWFTALLLAVSGSVVLAILGLLYSAFGWEGPVWMLAGMVGIILAVARGVTE